MQKNTIWLLAIIVLTIVAFLTVFKPITLSARKNPQDASLYLRPVGPQMPGWVATNVPKETFLLGGKSKVYVYPPTHDLSLGLDLRGGLRVQLAIENQGKFEYKLAERLDPTAISTKQKKLSDAVTSALGALGGEPEVVIAATGDYVTVTTLADQQSIAQQQYEQVTKAMRQVFPGPEAFTEPDPSTIFATQNSEADKKMREDVTEILKKRIDPDGTRELNAFTTGNGQVVIEIPGEKDPEHVKTLLKTTAQLRLMLLPPTLQVSGEDRNGNVTISDLNGATVETKEALKSFVTVVNGSDMVANAAQVGYDQAGNPEIHFELRSSKAPGEASAPSERFAAITGANIGKPLAIVLDNNIISAPTIQARISDKGVITGKFTMQEATDLATMLKAGALPVKLKFLETRTVSATLGQDSINKSLIAGAFGLLLVLVFMGLYYRLPGLMANIALVIYIFLVLAVIKLANSTLTLPGIAGIIISIGMAVDANVIIFERLKEELRAQKPLETAIEVAFSRAWTAILDSNVASLITGTVLYWLGTGAIQNFAITLMIGVAVSLFTAVTITRLLMKFMIRSQAGHKLAWYGV